LQLEKEYRAVSITTMENSKLSSIVTKLIMSNLAFKSLKLVLALFRDEIPFWIPFNHEKLHKNTVQAGKEGGQTLYIGRAEHSGALTPGKILENDLRCVIPWGTEAHSKDDYEMLVYPGEVKWVASQNGHAPINAFPGGLTEEGETLFISRVEHESGAILIGKMQPSHKVCYVAHEGKELNYKQYEILVV
jgi:Protein of unknown function (DUF3421)